MAIETSFTVRASPKGFTEMGRAIDDVGRKLKKINEEGSKVPGGRSIPARSIGPATPYQPSPRVLPGRPGSGPNMPSFGPGTYVPNRPQFAPAYVPGLGPATIPKPSSPGVGPGPGGGTPVGPPPGGPATPDPLAPGDGPGKKKTTRKDKLSGLGDMAAAYNALAQAAEAAGRQIDRVNAHVASGMGNLRELAGLFQGRRGGSGGGGGGSGGGGTGSGGGPKPPKIPKRVTTPAEPPDRSLKSLFGQGFLEGLLPNIGGLTTGGMGGLAQFGGRLGARAALGLGDFGIAAAQAPFRGVSGIQNAISRVPFIGGTLADASAQVFQNAGTAIGFEQMQQANLPYLGRTGVRGSNLGFRGGPGMFNFDQLSALGLRKAGMGSQQAQQYLVSLAQASGNTADNPLVGGALGSSLSAFSRYGVGPEIAGTFVQGQRLQGASNNNGINGFIRSLAAGREGLGLEGTELTDYMRQMAEDIASFKQTGIPIATESIGALGTSFRSSGISGVRAAGLAGNFTRTAQSVGMDGPQSAQDYALLQAVAGRPLNGIDDSLDVMDKLQQGLSPKDTQRAFRNLMGTARGLYGNDKKGRFGQRQFFKGLGLNFSSREYDALQRSGGGGLNDEQIANFNQRLNQEAAGNVSSVTQAQSRLDNTSLSLGMQGLETYFKSEQFHKDLSSGIVQGLMPYVNKMDKLIVGLYDHVVGRKAALTSLSPGQAVGRQQAMAR